MNSSGAMPVAAASTFAAAIFGGLHLGSLATVAAVLLVGFLSAWAAQSITRRSAVKQIRQIADEAIAEHVKEMHATKDEVIQEAAGYRPDRT